MLEQLELINRISDEVNKDLDQDNMLRRILDLTVDHLDATTGSIMLFDEDNRVSDFILQQEHPNARRIIGTILTEGFGGWVLAHGQGSIVYDTRTDERWITYPNQPYDVLSAIATPLRRKKGIIGILTLVHEEPNNFSEQEFPLLNAIAGQAAIALENARLFKQTEQEREKLSAIINSTQDAVLVTGPDNHVLLLNPSAQEMIKLNHNDWENEKIVDMTDNIDLLKLFSPDTSSTGEVTLSDGRTMWASITNIPMGQVTVLRDITPFKALDQMKRDFVTAFTHDLRTPLATVKGYVELVRMDGDITKRQEEDLVGINRVVNMMKDLVDDLLELSRLERLEELVREELDYKQLVKDVVDSFKVVARQKNIQLVIQNLEEATVEGNETLLKQAIGNLIDNAIKYTPKEGSVFINMEYRKDNFIQVSVRDHGPGINPKDLPRVWEKFVRLRPEVDDVPGTGLGLSIVKTIVEQHDGFVGVESELGVGSTFMINLPIVSAS